MNIEEKINELKKVLDKAKDRSVDRNILFRDAENVVQMLRLENAERCNDNPYTSEKITEYMEHLRRILGFRKGGSSPEGEYTWALKALDALKSEFCFNTKNL
jgi:RNA-splicing ligase RtcB